VKEGKKPITSWTNLKKTIPDFIIDKRHEKEEKLRLARVRKE
jgi:hypothetical protein